MLFSCWALAEAQWVHCVSYVPCSEQALVSSLWTEGQTVRTVLCQPAWLQICNSVLLAFIVSTMRSDGTDLWETQWETQVWSYGDHKHRTLELCLMAAAGSQLSSRYLTFLNNRALEKQLLTIQKQTSKTKTQNLWGWRYGSVIRNICSCRRSHCPCGLLMTVCNQSSKALTASSITCTHIPIPQSVVQENNYAT